MKQKTVFKIKDENKSENTDSKPTIKYIRVNDEFLLNAQKYDGSKINMDYSSIYKNNKSVLNIVESIKKHSKYDFVSDILISMLICDHCVLSIMPMHYETGKADFHWIAIICEKCHFNWHFGEQYGQRKNNNKKNENNMFKCPFPYQTHINCIKRKYDTESGSMKRTKLFHSLEKKRHNYQQNKQMQLRKE